jgi:SAM-dependent methyltransferase
MEALRKLHNNCKRSLILKWVEPRSLVLDCGCGRGGDWHKWKAVQARVAAIDPDAESLAEAERRALDMHFGVWFLGQGDVRQAAASGPFDVVCYNFSLHYIFENENTFKESVDAIARAIRPGGLLIGITPEKARAEGLCPESAAGTPSEGLCPFTDSLGNSIQIKDDKLLVHLVDGPFYADGPKAEPLLDSGILIEALMERGFSKLVWEPMLPAPNGLISDLYSKFVFKKI